MAVGNPFGLGGTVTAGIVSARAREFLGPYNDLIQIDAPVNQGNSGGPTFNASGQVIGINSAIVSPTGGSVGVGFAIPAETVKTIAARLKDKGTVSRGWIGVEVQSASPEIAEGLGLNKPVHGVLVAEIQPDSPAAKAGIEPGDIITSVAGQPAGDDRELIRRVSDMPPASQRDLLRFPSVDRGELEVDVLSNQRFAKSRRPSQSVVMRKQSASRPISKTLVRSRASISVSRSSSNVPNPDQ